MTNSAIVRLVLDEDSRARDFFHTGIEAQRNAQLALRNGNDSEAWSHHAHYQEDMRYVTRRISHLLHWSYEEVKAAILEIAKTEMSERGPLTLVSAQ